MVEYNKHFMFLFMCFLQYLQKGLSLCLRVCGRYHMLSARFHINIGIYYEDNGDFIRAYELFKDWAEICTEVRDSKDCRRCYLLDFLDSRQTDRRTDKWTDRQTDRQTDRHIFTVSHYGGSSRC